ncbi:helix-turn-helix domain-containing protein [Corallococcus terminator]|uniref:DNA-binding protein n=1 Tax=Corallococcus terminator TaxID=2316733 RepID=A0A3A8I644_9BACT|nr:helix-turn-helix domain-containing protein [Corallococcus terminator]RKG78615.1 DNA-binding protein [Corallococcus terminator]
MSATITDPEDLPVEERRLAARLNKELAVDSPGKAARLVLPSGEQVELPDSMVSVLRTIMEALANGSPVSIIPMHREMTTQEAADFLNISRQHLVTLLEQGKLPHSRPGKHRRLRASDVIAYRRKRQAEMEAGLQEIVELDKKMGDYFGS